MLDRRFTDHLRDRLAALRTRDGAWSYAPGAARRLEPTCWALRALGSAAAPQARAILETWPREDGLLVDALEGCPPNNAFNALAAVVALECGHEALATELSIALASKRPAVFGPFSVTRQDNSLQGWGWIAEEFSWVEPTAWCVLALKRVRPAVPSEVLPAMESRIAGGERVLADRACVGGGWNHGNSNMMGAILPAYVPATSVALLALADRPDAPVVARGLKWLVDAARSEPSRMGMALACVALRTHGQAAPGIREHLKASVDARRDDGDVLSLALALYALNSGDPS